MTNLTDTLNTLLEKAFTDAGLEAAHATEHARATISGRPELADYQCNGALALAKPLGKNPRELAETIKEKLLANPQAESVFSEVTLAGPGFINLRLTNSFLQQHAADLMQSPHMGVRQSQGRTKTILDYAGPNMGKPMHVGHLRPAIIGESLKRVLRFKGENTFGDVHFGDWGMPMGMIIHQIETDQPDLPFFDENRTEFPTASPLTIDQIGDVYKKAAARGKEDEDAKKQMRLTAAALQEGHPGYLALFELLRGESLKAAEENFAHLNVDFDLWHGEYTVKDMLEPMVADLLERGLARKDQGAVIIPAEEEGKAPLILEKSDGGYTYGATDLATIKNRTENMIATKIIYVVDRRQSEHFDQVFAAARAAGYDHESALIFAPNGTINGPDGKPLKSREGTPKKMNAFLNAAIEKAREKLPDSSADFPENAREALAQQIGIATIKFQDLHNNRTTDYIFDLEQFSRFEGKTGPYLQYSVARINSIFDKAGLTDARGMHIAISHEAERELLLAIAQFADVIERVAEKLEPNTLCEQAFKVAQKFSAFYEVCPILHTETAEADRQSRLALADLTRRHQKICLELLGIDAPHKMLTRATEEAA